jgi:ABC-2 type transport system permease protein
VSGFSAVYRREMFSLWVTPLAWVLLAAFLLIQGASFFVMVQHLAGQPAASVDTGPVQAYFGQSIFLLFSFLLVCPALTMRSFAEERRLGTVEALLTAPVTPAALVLGKYAATLSTYALMWAPTVLYVVILRKTGQVDWPVVASSYLGVIAIGAGYLAIGTLMSALTQSQLIAFLLAAMLQLGLLVLGVAEYVAEAGPLRELCAHVSALSQMEEMSRGLIDLRRLVFDATLVALPLFVTTRVVESWRWG